MRPAQVGRLGAARPPFYKDEVCPVIHPVPVPAPTLAAAIVWGACHDCQAQVCMAKRACNSCCRPCWQEQAASRYWDRLNVRLERTIKLGGVCTMEAELWYFGTHRENVPQMQDVHRQVGTRMVQGLMFRVSGATHLCSPALTTGARCAAYW